MNVIRLFENDIEKYKIKIKSLLKQSFKLSFPKEEIDETLILNRIQSLKEYIKEGNAVVYGVINKESLNGFVWFFIKNQTNSNRIHINQIVVEENIRGKGLGNILIEAVENYAKEKKIKEIDLFVTKQNYNATKFYENKGFDVERLVMLKRL